MSKTIKISVLLLIVALLLPTISTIASNVKADSEINEEEAYIDGKMAKEYYGKIDEISEGNEDNVIILSSDAIDIQLDTAIRAHDQLGLEVDIDDLRIAIQDEIVRREVLYQEALNNGIVVGDEEVDAYVAEVREAVKNTSNYDDYLLFIQGYGATEDEYWNDQRDLVKKELVIEKYINILENKVITESSLEEDSIECNEVLAEEINHFADELTENYEVILK